MEKHKSSRRKKRDAKDLLAVMGTSELQSWQHGS